MSDRSQDETQPESSKTKDTGLRASVQVFESYEEARADEIARQARLSPYERMQQFIELQRRVWGTDNPDVRESGEVNIKRRDE
jgi:alkanesulfonate monooxygenase SsuD/methylene tetrahydromethanopterin reductase-like flavin-dependent oxidoreductase (luciferase family)